MREPELTPYEQIARNIRIKLALRVKGTIYANVTGNQIEVSIVIYGISFSKTVTITDLNNTDSTLMSENIYKSYRKFIMKKFFTFD